MSRRVPALTLHGWLLATLLPALGLVIIAYAILVYGRLHGFIIAGFDAKLTSISTTTAAFIDPADHQRLVEPLPLTSLTRDSVGNWLWALDASEHRFLKIHPSDGLAEETGIAVPPEINNITHGMVGGELYLVDNQAGHFLRMVTSTGQITPAFDLAPPIYAIATAVAPRLIYVAGRNLRAYHVDTGVVTEVGSLPENLRDLTWDRHRQVLWGLGAGGNELLEIDPGNAGIRSRKKLLLEKADPSEPAPAQPVELRTLVYDSAQAVLFGTNTSLVRVDPDTGIVSAKDYLPSFGQEQGPMYARYARPMTRIMDRANLTYLYSQIVQGRDHILYGLDGTVGKDHSPLLSTDTVRDAEVDGVQRLLTAGTPYVSDVEPWPPWGLLKSSFAPIFNDQGRPVAMAGADVNAGTIQFRIRRALVITFGFGAAMLIVAGILTLAIARGLTGPLHAIRTAALRAAAGDYSQRARIERPRELVQLAQRFGTAAGLLGQEVQELKDTQSVRQAARDRTALVERLGRTSASAGAPPALWAWGTLGAIPSGEAPPGGGVGRGDRALAWLARPSEAPLAAAARHAEIAVTVEALLARPGSDAAALGAALEKLFLADVAAWALLTPDGLHAWLRAPARLFRYVAGGPRTELAAADFAAPRRPGPGEALVLAVPDAPFAALPSSFPPGDPAAFLAAWQAGAARAGARTFVIVGLSPA